MAEEEKLKLGKGAWRSSRAASNGSRRSMRSGRLTSRRCRKPIMQTETHYLGMVVTKKGGTLLADLTVHGRPTVNDLATLLANAMSRPLAGDAHRPRLIRLKGHHQWRELFPVLEELGIEISVEQKLPGIEKAYRARIRQMREEQRTGMVKPTEEQAKVEAMFPAIARYVQGYGYVEIGDQESFGFVVAGLGLRRAGLRGRHARDTR